MLSEWDRKRSVERMQMRHDCFSSGWVELFGLSCCRLPLARRLDSVCVCCYVCMEERELVEMQMNPQKS